MTIPQPWAADDMTRAAAALLIAMLVWPVTARSEEVVHPAGQGVIHVCRNWDMTGASCREYHHIKLPPRIRVGDAFRVEYGSNPKSFQFVVGRIEVQDGTCLIHGGPIGSSEDRIRVACQNAE
jgi:hypothetical protein